MLAWHSSLPILSYWHSTVSQKQKCCLPSMVWIVWQLPKSKTEERRKRDEHLLSTCCVVRHCVTHSVPMKWHQTWQNPGAQTMRSGLWLSPCPWSSFLCLTVFTHALFTQWQDDRQQPHPRSLRAEQGHGWKTVPFHVCIAIPRKIQIGLILSWVHDWTNHLPQDLAGLSRNQSGIVVDGPSVEWGRDFFKEPKVDFSRQTKILSK